MGLHLTQTTSLILKLTDWCPQHTEYAWKGGMYPWGSNTWVIFASVLVEFFRTQKWREQLFYLTHCNILRQMYFSSFKTAYIGILLFALEQNAV